MLFFYPSNFGSDNYSTICERNDRATKQKPRNLIGRKNYLPLDTLHVSRQSNGDVALTKPEAAL